PVMVALRLALSAERDPFRDDGQALASSAGGACPRRAWSCLDGLPGPAWPSCLDGSDLRHRRRTLAAVPWGTALQSRSPAPSARRGTDRPTPAIARTVNHTRP